MKKKYSNEDERDLAQEVIKYRAYKKISKGSLFVGVAGLAITAINYYFSGEPSLQTLNEPASQMNNIQLIDTTLFGISSIGYIGGGLMYGLFSFMQDSLKDQFKKEKTKNNIEKTLKD